MTSLKNIRKYAEILSRGVVRELAPEMAGGFLVEWFHHKKIDVAKISSYVAQDTSLWEKVSPKDQDTFRWLAQRVGNLNWITAERVINTIKGDFPGVASLFLGDQVAYSWLERQVEELKNFALEG